MVTKYFMPLPGQTLIYLPDAEHIVKVERGNGDVRYVAYASVDGGLSVNFAVPFHGREPLTVVFTQANGLDKAIGRLNE